MATDDKIRDDTLQYGINRKAAKISALSSGKINKYEDLTGEEILPFNQIQMIEQTKFTYSSPKNAFKKQRKIIANQGEKQTEALESSNFSNKINEMKISF